MIGPAAGLIARPPFRPGDTPLPAAKSTVARQLAAIDAAGKVVSGEEGWLFLANDASEFLRVQFGRLGWTAAERERAAGVMRVRRRALAQRGIAYRKYIVPDKSVVYPEKLPRGFAGLPRPEPRPAQMLAADVPEVVAYLGEDLAAGREYGPLFFRAGSHSNWLGAWVVYAGIVRRLGEVGILDGGELIQGDDLLPSQGDYGGDLVPLLDDGTRAAYAAEYGDESVLQYRLSPGRRRAARVEEPAEYAAWFPERERFVYERADGQGLRAVIFRDSGLELCHDLMAQHFARSVFIWHRGQVVEEVIAREQPDIVLHVMEERMATRYRVFPAMSSVAAASPAG